MARPKKTASSFSAHKKIHIVPGLFDVVPDANAYWEVALKRLSAYAKSYGFTGVYAPIVEDAHLYEVVGGVESASQLRPAMVQSNSGDVSLRATFLPGLLRAYHTSKIFDTKPLVKWVFSGQTLQIDSKGNFVSDFEYGFEVLGAFNHLTEAQVLSAVWEMLQSLGLDISFELNHSGTANSQSSYSGVLEEFCKGKKYDLCDNCVGCLSGRVMDILRCRELDCQAILAEAPTILDFLDADDRKYFTNILEALEELQIPYQLNPLYTGVEGTSGTVCLVKYKGKNENIVIGEAGYHNGLAQKIVGKPYQAFGFIGSMQKLVASLALANIEVSREHKSEVYLVPLGELAAKKSLRLFRDLTAAKIFVYDNFGNVGVKSQLRAAQDSKSPIALIMGQKEAMDEMVILRDVKSGMQEMFSYDKILEEVKKRLGK